MNPTHVPGMKRAGRTVRSPPITDCYNCARSARAARLGHREAGVGAGIGLRCPANNGLPKDVESGLVRVSVALIVV